MLYEAGNVGAEQCTTSHAQTYTGRLPVHVILRFWKGKVKREIK